jgi:restriction system protein
VHNADAVKRELRHQGLKKYRVITGSDWCVVEQKAAAQMAAWDEMWRRRLMVEKAQAQTREACQAIWELENTLHYALTVHNALDWEALKDKSSFSKPQPKMSSLQHVQEPPRQTEPKYEPQFGFLDKLFSSRRSAKTRKAQEVYRVDYEQWKIRRDEILKANAELQEQYNGESQQWRADKEEFQLRQTQRNDEIEHWKAEYFRKNPAAILDYCEFVLDNSRYPDCFPKKFDLDYPQTDILIVDYSLPSIDAIPRVKEVRYMQSRDELVPTLYSATSINKLYDGLIYQITLRTIHELYEADAANTLESVVFNGWVTSIDRATGKQIAACILSVQANRREFLSINLGNVDPKLCFKNLKGIGSSKLHSLTPIAPILSISREDKRFVSSYEVVDELDESSNLAAMDWEDFEHLIREVFEKEFAQSGGEVKVTQASRDGGVDAVAFDPDPIRGGKIVIQAKRYTDTVGVSAVRDLYGTVINEGATKGILVTTADYGPDAYEFAKGKPLTLLNGSNLLHLLDKHGHKATINLRAAKLILSEKERDKP